MQVFKFGGASVKDSLSVRNVLSILQKHAQEPTIVVVSAMGKTTNLLEAISKAYFFKEGDAQSLFEELKSYHLNIASDLFSDPSHPVFEELNNVFVELQWAVEEEPSYTFDFHYDQIVSQGEILSTKIIAAFLNASGLQTKWLDARGLIQTDNTYREGKVNYELSERLVQSELIPCFNANAFVLTQGFIGGTSENFSTTLGREGSDYTAALLAYFTDAQRVVIWKDVAGVLNADPKYFRNTKKIDELSYHDAIELTYYGASVIHPKTIKPLQNKGIPLYVKSFLDPGSSGTAIKEGDMRYQVSSYIFKTKQILLSIQAKDFSFIAEDNLSEIFNLLSKFNVRANMMQNSAISFSLCVDDEAHKIQSLLSELQKQFKVLYNSGVELMTVRNYNQDILDKLTLNKTILLEQRSRHTCQLVMK
ncbi:MAG TPA: aspartate kinase [Bacteroidia bacterium]|nr:aspartate kinase [Bacteroidia bacterium]